jgi:SAM-dependent methyltransferase
VGSATSEFSERCVEIPWVSAHIGSAAKILDIGWSMSPPEWLGVLLAARRPGVDLTGIDIVDPGRVRSRFLPEMLEDVMAVPVIVGDILTYEPLDEIFDLITCVSTLEHIGFDQATPTDMTETVFVRAETPEGVEAVRAPTTDQDFLDKACQLLESGGRLLLTVPVGANRPILHQDSLGLFTYQFEYGQEPWEQILADPRFSVTDSAFFGWSAEDGWQEVDRIMDLTHHTSELRPFAVGCACVELTRN